MNDYEPDDIQLDPASFFAKVNDENRYFYATPATEGDWLGAGVIFEEDDDGVKTKVINPPRWLQDEADRAIQWENRVHFR